MFISLKRVSFINEKKIGQEEGHNTLGNLCTYHIVSPRQVEVTCFKHDRIIKTRKNKNLEKLFRENKTSPLLKTPEKDFQQTFELSLD